MAVQIGKKAALVWDESLSHLYSKAKAALDLGELWELGQLLIKLGVDKLIISQEMLQAGYKVENENKEKCILQVETPASFMAAIENDFKCIQLLWPGQQSIGDQQEVYLQEYVKGGGGAYLQLPDPAILLRSAAAGIQLQNLFKRGLIKGINLWGLTDNAMTIAPLLDHIRSIFAGPIGICPTNQSYQATGIAFEGLAGGADMVNTSIAGALQGEGRAALEELLLAAKVLGKWEVQADFALLPQVVRLYQKLAQDQISQTKPILGHKIFCYESGIHAAGIAEDSGTYEPYEPSMVGLERQHYIGKHSGTKSLRAKLLSMGIAVTIGEAAYLLPQVREMSIEKKGAFTDEELAILHYSSFRNQACG